MPTRAPRLCSCGKTCRAGARCACQLTRDAIRKASQDAARPSSAERGYDSAWRNLRAAFLAANPLCCVTGCGAAATDADHVLSVRARPDLRLAWSNLRPYCHRHHSQRTAREQGFARSSRGEW